MEKKKKTGPDECCRAERQIGYEVRTLNQVIGRLVNSYQSKVDEKAGINRRQWRRKGLLPENLFQEMPD